MLAKRFTQQCMPSDHAGRPCRQRGWSRRPSCRKTRNRPCPRTGYLCKPPGTGSSFLCCNSLYVNAAPCLRQARARRAGRQCASPTPPLPECDHLSAPYTNRTYDTRNSIAATDMRVGAAGGLRPHRRRRARALWPRQQARPARLPAGRVHHRAQQRACGALSMISKVCHRARHPKQLCLLSWI